jgi:hypothetical protein
MCKSGASNGALSVATRGICRIVLGFVLDRAFARTRTYETTSEHQALTNADAHLDAHKIRHSAELIEIFRAWWRLPEPLKAAVLAIIRSSHKG